MVAPSTLARPAFAAPPAKHAAAPIKERATIVCRRGARMPLVARALSRGSPPGGIIHCGEAPLDAARRALEEQTRLAGLELMYFFHVDGHAKRPPCSSPACRPACARARAARSPAAAGRLPTRSRACLCVPVTTPTRATVARLASAEGAPPARDGRRAASHVLVADVAAHLAAEHPI
ncbi:NUDIX domain-containing protein [Burkholderia pseudomallei]|nr:NUDIX domain-containing protein [Burkholderia pseudomallei]KGC46302.1 hydrolase, NUDIX family [Burkholderia pseudomallei]